MSKNITVETIVQADMENVWRAWNTPDDIEQWMHASEDWECPKAVNDLQVGGHFSFILASKDGATSFDLGGTYEAVDEHERISYVLDDGRKVMIFFDETEDGVRISETFEMEDENPEEMQRSGWQAILDNFKKHCESR